MSADIRARRTGLKPRHAKDRPLYARALALRHLRPSWLLCFLFFEGAIALATLLALAELVTWWAVLVLPATIAVMVKINDVIAGAGAPAGIRARARSATRKVGRHAAPDEPEAAQRSIGRAAVPPLQSLPLDEPVRSVETGGRHAAAHRYS